MKELIVEDVCDEQNLKQKTGPIEIMKHIYPTRNTSQRAAVPDFAQLPRALFQSEKKQDRDALIDNSHNFTAIPSGSLTLPEKCPKRRCNSSVGQASTAASQEIDELQIEVSDDFTSQIELSVTKYPSTQPVSPNQSNESTPTLPRENSNKSSLLVNREKPVFKIRSSSARPTKPIKRVWRVCDEKHSSEANEHILPGMFERMHYRPENQWVI